MRTRTPRDWNISNLLRPTACSPEGKARKATGAASNPRCRPSPYLASICRSRSGSYMPVGDSLASARRRRLRVRRGGSQSRVGACSGLCASAMTMQRQERSGGGQGVPLAPHTLVERHVGGENARKLPHQGTIGLGFEPLVRSCCAVLVDPHLERQAQLRGQSRDVRMTVLVEPYEVEAAHVVATEVRLGHQAVDAWVCRKLQQGRLLMQEPRVYRVVCRSQPPPVEVDRHGVANGVPQEGHAVRVGGAVAARVE